MRKKLLLAFLAIMPSAVQGWEADGFQSGVTVQRVEKELASWGVSERRRFPISDYKNVYSISSSGRWFSFCNDRLYEYDRSFDVTISSFALMLQTVIDQLGQPGLTSTGPVTTTHRGVWFRWSKGKDELLLILAQDGSKKLEATRRHTDNAVLTPCR